MLGFITSVLAIIISIYSVWRGEVYFKKNVKIEKIEEIYSIIESLAISYNGLHTIYNLLCDYHSPDADIITRRHAFEVYTEHVQLYKQNHDIEEIMSKIDRLEVLARAYLNPKKSLKVMAFKKMVLDMTECAIQMQTLKKEAFWREGFPFVEHVNAYADDLGNLLIEEIGFAHGDKKYRESLREYIEKTFKEDINLK